MIKYLLGFLKFFFRKNVSIFARVTYDSKISAKAKIYRYAQIYSSQVGDYSYIAPKTNLIYANVGKFCSIGSDCKIGLGNHTVDFISTSPIFTETKNGTGTQWIKKNVNNAVSEPVNVGNDVWIGVNAIIKSGLTIGDGAIIGAGSIVTKDVPPYSIVAGVPAKVIGYRFEEPVMKDLLEIKWWDLPHEQIKQKIKYFQKEKIRREDLKIFFDH